MRRPYRLEVFPCPELALSASSRSHQNVTPRTGAPHPALASEKHPGHAAVWVSGEAASSMKRGGPGRPSSPSARDRLVTPSVKHQRRSVGVEAELEDLADEDLVVRRVVRAVEAAIEISDRAVQDRRSACGCAVGDLAEGISPARAVPGGEDAG